ncbi:hypothetical protein [Ileibacterium valens]|uniref:hypothetical protein n=1 Tax=Ileibacterium valens TaxID=1862668 RepID=UPI002731A188|nr:hypothetical protein [Ileibacterium valens]
MWRKDYCSEECRRIYNLCVRWHRGVLDPEEAFAELVKCDLERLDNMPDDIREILEDILDLGAPSIEEQPE